MTYALNNMRRVLRELRQERPADVPARLWRYAKPKLDVLGEEVLYRARLMGPLAARYRGPGIALMFHEIQSNVDDELRTGCSAGHLRQVIHAVRAAGRDIVTPDEALRRLGDRQSAPFALLTFDDAYADNRLNALPVLQELDVPMTLFVPTGMITREIDAWWLVLRAALRSRSEIALPPMERTFQCPDLASKTAALRQITAWVGTDQARAESLSETLGPLVSDPASLVARYAMDAKDLTQFAQHPLVTIGAHTETHRFLSQLSDGEVLAEFTSNKNYLEALLGQPVEVLAYPYGTPGACGEREARLAREAGFKAAFTTRPGHLFPDHLKTPHLLPRIDVGYTPQRRSALFSRLSGFQRAMTTRWGAPVAVLD